MLVGWGTVVEVAGRRGGWGSEELLLVLTLCRHFMRMEMRTSPAVLQFSTDHTSWPSPDSFWAITANTPDVS